MLAAVYRLRHRGIKLPRPTEPREGQITLAPVELGERRQLKARLLDGERDLLPPLIGAHVTRITRHGVVIQGIELDSRVPGSAKAKVRSHPQTWWVLVRTLDLSEAFDEPDPLNELAQQQHNALFGPGNGTPPHKRFG